VIPATCDAIKRAKTDAAAKLQRQVTASIASTHRQPKGRTGKWCEAKVLIEGASTSVNSVSDNNSRLSLFESNDASGDGVDEEATTEALALKSLIERHGGQEERWRGGSAT